MNSCPFVDFAFQPDPPIMRVDNRLDETQAQSRAGDLEGVVAHVTDQEHAVDEAANRDASKFQIAAQYNEARGSGLRGSGLRGIGLRGGLRAGGDGDRQNETEPKYAFHGKAP